MNVEICCANFEWLSRHRRWIIFSTLLQHAQHFGSQHAFEGLFALMPRKCRAVRAPSCLRWKVECSCVDCKLEERLRISFSKAMNSLSAKSTHAGLADPGEIKTGAASILSDSKLSLLQPARTETTAESMHRADSRIVETVTNAGAVAGLIVGVARKAGRDDVGVFAQRPTRRPTSGRQDVWAFFPDLCKIFGEADALAIMSAAVRIATKTSPDDNLDKITAVALLSIATALAGPADPRISASDHINKLLRLPYHVEEEWRRKVRRIGGGCSQSLVAAAEWKLLQLIGRT